MVGVIKQESNMDKDIYLLDYYSNRDKQVVYAPLYDYLELIDRPTTEKMLDEHHTAIKQRDCLEVENYDKNISQIALSLTDTCNLKCRYCYAHGGYNDGKGHSNNALIYSVLKTYFKYLQSEKQQKCNISFDGGCEATCAFDLMQYAVATANEFASSYGIEVTFSMATNGYFNEEVLRFVTQNFDAISLSFDGPKAVQDYHRPTVSGKGSYEKVFRTAKILHDSSVNLAIRVVVTNYNVHRLDETLTFFESSLPGSKVVFGTMDNTDFITDVAPPDEAVYAASLKKLSEKSYNLNWTTVNTKLFGGLKSSFCSSMSKPNWFVKTDGRVNTCMRDTQSNKPMFDIGYFNSDRNKVELDYRQLEYLKTFNIYDQDDCKSCFAKYICGGGCPYLRERNQQKCDLIREEALDYINERYDDQQTIRLLQDIFLNLDAK